MRNSWAAKVPLVTRSILLTGAALLCALSAFTTRFDLLTADGALGQRLIGLGGASAADWFALFALIVIAWRASPTAPDRADWIVAGIATMCSLAPLGQIGGAGLTLVALYSLFRVGGCVALRQSGIVMLALATTLVWGPIASQLLGPLVLVPDAWAAGIISGTGSKGNLVGSAIILGPGCSSLHNLSIAFLIWATITQVMDLPISRRLLWGLAAAVAAMLAINQARVVTIVLNMQDFDYWHVGGGAAIFGLAAFLAALTITIFVTDRETRARI